MMLLSVVLFVVVLLVLLLLQWVAEVALVLSASTPAKLPTTSETGPSRQFVLVRALVPVLLSVLALTLVLVITPVVASALALVLLPARVLALASVRVVGSGWCIPICPSTRRDCNIQTTCGGGGDITRGGEGVLFVREVGERG